MFILFRDINDIAPENSTAKISLLGSYDPQKELIIEDPYFAYVCFIVYIYNKLVLSFVQADLFGLKHFIHPLFQNHNKNAFNEVYEQCMRCCTAFLDSVSQD